jgi:hypothetical protein
MRKHTFKMKKPLWLLMLALLLPYVWAEDADVISVPDIEAEGKSSEVEAGPENEAELEEEAREGEEEAKNGGKPRFTLASGSPAHGPVTGDTKVLVRADRFQRYS